MERLATAVEVQGDHRLPSHIPSQVTGVWRSIQQCQRICYVCALLSYPLEVYSVGLFLAIKGWAGEGLLPSLLIIRYYMRAGSTVGWEDLVNR
jgi:hypothetical protein